MNINQNLINKMKKLIFFTIISFLINSCENELPQLNENKNDLEKSYYYNETLEENLNDKNELAVEYPSIDGQFTIEPIVDNQATLTSIKVYWEGKLHQTITYEDYYEKVELIDWNFDGYKDISVLESAGNTGNTFYSVWLFNPENKIYARNKELDSKSGFIDTVNQLIVNHYRTGFELELWEYYSFKNSKLVFDHGKKKELVSYKGKRAFKTTLSENIQGKIIEEDSYEFLD